MASNAADDVGALPGNALFLFDLNGFVVVPGVLNAAEVAAANDAIDSHRGDARERVGTALRNAMVGTALSAEGGRTDLGGMLGWEASPGRDVFRSVLAHPILMAYLTAFCGEGYVADICWLAVGIFILLQASVVQLR